MERTRGAQASTIASKRLSPLDAILFIAGQMTKSLVKLRMKFLLLLMRAQLDSHEATVAAVLLTMLVSLNWSISSVVIPCKECEYLNDNSAYVDTYRNHGRGLSCGCGKGWDKADHFLKQWDGGMDGREYTYRDTHDTALLEKCVHGGSSRQQAADYGLESHKIGAANAWNANGDQEERVEDREWDSHVEFQAGVLSEASLKFV
jgi:hypothetical protein